MVSKDFEFETYRLNVIQGETFLFEGLGKPIKTDMDFIKILEHSVSSGFDQENAGKKNIFRWSVRDFCRFYHLRKEDSSVYGVTIAKSLVESTGNIVTDKSIEAGQSAPNPPLADICHLFFYMQRHILIIERCGSIINSSWRQAFQEIFKKAANDLQYNSWIELEPIPRYEEILEAFRSFEILTRLRIILRLPNPELSRYSDALYKEMEQGGIREYLQDMKNPRGLKKDEGKLPHASTEIAAAGYKKGEVVFEGKRNGKREVIKTGSKAARGSVSKKRDYVKEMKDMAKTQEAKKTTTEILDEIDRIAPPPQVKKK